MKRKGYILEKVADMENLRRADRQAQDGKDTRAIRRHNMRADENLLNLQRMILNLDFPKANMRLMRIVSDAGKERNIIVQTYYPWYILYHAIMLVIEPDFTKNYIYDISACIKGRGTHYGVKRMKMFLRRYPEYKWFGKSDKRKFYESIPHEVIIYMFRRKYKDERFIKLIEIIIHNYSCSVDILNDLEDEKEKRRTNRLLCKSADWELRFERGRSRRQRGVKSQMLSPILR